LAIHGAKRVANHCEDSQSSCLGQWGVHRVAWGLLGQQLDHILALLAADLQRTSHTRKHSGLEAHQYHCYIPSKHTTTRFKTGTLCCWGPLQAMPKLQIHAQFQLLSGVTPTLLGRTQCLHLGRQKVLLLGPISFRRQDSIVEAHFLEGAKLEAPHLGALDNLDVLYIGTL